MRTILVKWKENKKRRTALFQLMDDSLTKEQAMDRIINKLKEKGIDTLPEKKFGFIVSEYV